MVRQYVDNCFKAMPHFNFLLHFKNGIMHLTGFTGGRWRSVLRSLVCVIADIFDGAQAWTVFVVSMLDAYILLSARAHSDASIDLLREAYLEMEHEGVGTACPHSNAP